MRGLRVKRVPLALSRATIGILVMAWTLAGCGADSATTAAPPPGAPLRLEMTGEGQWRELTTVARLTPTREDSAEQGPTWDAQARFHQILRVPESVDPEQPLALFAYGPGTRMLKVPGPLDPAVFDRLTLTILSEQTVHLRLILRRAGQPVLASDELSVAAATTARRVTFPMAMLHGLREPFDDLLVRVVGPGHLALMAVELEGQSPEGWLPRPETGPAPVAVAGESRPALGLGPTGRLVGQLLPGPPPAGGTLAFTFNCAVPAEVSSAPGESSLRLRIEPAGGPRDGQPALERDYSLKSGQAWTSHSLDLSQEWVRGGFNYAFSIENGGLEAESSGAPPGPAACAVTPPLILARAEAAPTVVLITSDTHRADHLGAAGGDVAVATPILDALARRGLFLEDCYSSTNVTNPSHVALFTGTHPRDTGITDNVTPLAAAAPTLAEAFRSAGYTTSMAVSAIHLAPEHSGLGQGFDRVAFPPDADRDGARTLAACAEWWAETEGQPLFLWLHLFDAHAPYEVPTELLAPYYPAERDPYATELPELPSHQRPAWDREIRDLEHLDARYRAEITYLDGLVGELLEHPRVAAGWLAFTSDHGESLGAHDIYWDHRELYPDTLAVPLILAGPNVPKGQRRRAPLSQLDLGRTLLDLAGLGAVPFPGESLLGIPDELALAEGADPGTSVLRFALSANATSASVAVDEYFLVLHLMEHTLHADLPRLTRHRVELYNLAQDPTCASDLVLEDGERARALRRLLIKWLNSPRAANWAGAAEIMATAHLEDLAGLGYAGGAESGTGWFDEDCSCSWCSRFSQ